MFSALQECEEDPVRPICTAWPRRLHHDCQRQSEDVRFVLNTCVCVCVQHTATLVFISSVLCPGFELDSVHETPDPVHAVRNAEGIFIGRKDFS